MPPKTESICVVVRVRPLNKTEQSQGMEAYVYFILINFVLCFVFFRIVQMDEDNGVVFVKNPDKPDETPKNFFFDKVFGPEFAFLFKIVLS